MTEITARPWHETIRLRADIMSGELSLKAFAADLYDAMLRRNRAVFNDPKELFSLTYPTVRLRALARDVTRRLGGKVEQDVVDRVNAILGKIKTGWKVG
jgi:predicted AAA+ superfamily ATPase